MIKDLATPKKGADIPRNIPVVLVTPEQAQEWLETRFDNERLIRANKVTAFARDMENGFWLFNGDTIRFNQDGRLIDGQHRLKAIIESKTAQWFGVVNIPDEARAGIDTGSSRTLGDLLRIGNHIMGRELAAIVRRVLIYRDGLQSTGGGRYLPTHAEGVEFVQANEEALRESLKFAVKAHQVRVPAAPSALAAAHFVCARVDKETADSVFERAVTGLNITEGDPVGAYRDKWIKHFSNFRTNLSPDDVFRFGILVFNMTRKGLIRTRLQAPRGGWSRDNVPVPE